LSARSTEHGGGAAEAQPGRSIIPERDTKSSRSNSEWRGRGVWCATFEWVPRRLTSTMRCAELFDTAENASCLDRRHFALQLEARMEVVRVHEAGVNPHRRHSALDDLSPINYERSHYSRSQPQSPSPSHFTGYSSICWVHIKPVSAAARVVLGNAASAKGASPNDILVFTVPYNANSACEERRAPEL